jgi:hypothetical protein
LEVIVEHGEKLVMFVQSTTTTPHTDSHVMLIQRRPHMFGLRDSPPTSHCLTNPRPLFDYYYSLIP